MIFFLVKVEVCVSVWVEVVVQGWARCPLGRERHPQIMEILNFNLNLTFVLGLCLWPFRGNVTCIGRRRAWKHMGLFRLNWSKKLSWPLTQFVHLLSRILKFGRWVSDFMECFRIFLKDYRLIIFILLAETSMWADCLAVPLHQLARPWSSRTPTTGTEFCAKVSGRQSRRCGTYYSSLQVYYYESNSRILKKCFQEFLGEVLMVVWAYVFAVLE